MEEIKLCDYGCGKEAKFKLTNGKSCCRENPGWCTEVRKNRSKFEEIETEELCSLGCGKIAKYKSKCGKLYCSGSAMSCPTTRSKMKISLKGHKVKKAIKIEENENILCDHGCGKIAKYQMNNGKYCCSDHSSKCDKLKEINRDKNSGENNKFYGCKHSEESIEKMRNNHDGREITPERNKKISIANTGKIRSEEFKENQRQFMLNGQAAYIHSFPVMGFKNHDEWVKNGWQEYANKFKKKVSYDELKLLKIVEQLYPNCIPQYKIFRYKVDIAIPEYKIAIEFDGYYHFDTPEHIEYHKMRQEKIESSGWKFYRVSMFDKFPTLEEVKNNIEKLITG